uniref:Uncharacterized protein n=1 Tax=Panagrellus redivivus TaxID=6233 RepID=A0A7E4VQ35_PANRE
MPYPLLKLPYDLQRRLRNLATPKEAYCLQVAVGQQKSYLHPIQMCFMDDLWDLFICNKDGNREATLVCLTLHCLNPPNNAAKLIRQKFGPHLKEFESSEIDSFSKTGFVNVKLGHNWVGNEYFALPQFEEPTGLWFQVATFEKCYSCEVKSDVVPKAPNGKVRRFFRRISKLFRPSLANSH